MEIEAVKKLSPLDRFMYWCRERHQIHLKRKVGLPKPWTNDKILQSYFFTNPYRENDKVTAWFRDKVRDVLRDDPRVLFATIAFRWFNHIPTGEVLALNHGWTFEGVRGPTDCLYFSPLCEWDSNNVKRALLNRQAEGHQIFTGAFIISTGSKKKPKVEYICDDVLEVVWKKRNDLLEEIGCMSAAGELSMQSVHKLLSELPGFGGGGFMAYEVVCDLRYTYLLDDADDKFTWCNPGPGALRGMNRLLKRPLDSHFSQEEWWLETNKLLDMCHRYLSKMPLFEMREVEHSLCEVDKYERALFGQGHMKRNYKGV